MITSNMISIRPPLDLLDHHDQEPLRISFHEEERDLDVSENISSDLDVSENISNTVSLVEGAKNR